MISMNENRFRLFCVSGSGPMTIGNEFSTRGRDCFLLEVPPLLAANRNKFVAFLEEAQMQGADLKFMCIDTMTQPAKGEIEFKIQSDLCLPLSHGMSINGMEVVIQSH